MPITPTLINLINIWPVVILIDKRNDKVRGRISFLIDSIKFNNGTNHIGLLPGVNEEKKIKGHLIINDTIINSHKITDITNIDIIWVVKPNTYGINPQKLNNNILINKTIITDLYKLNNH